jgi:hypothetical protein
MPISPLSFVARYLIGYELGNFCAAKGIDYDKTSVIILSYNPIGLVSSPKKLLVVIEPLRHAEVESVIKLIIFVAHFEGIFGEDHLPK